MIPFFQNSTLRALNLSQAIIEFKPNGKIIRANKNFLKTVKYSASEIVGKHHSIFVEPSYAATDDYTEFWRELGRGEFQCGEFHRMDKYGEDIWLQATYNPLINRLGQVTKIVKLATNITEQKKLQAEVQNRSQAVIEFTPNGTVLTANQKFLDAVGYTLDEVRGNPHRIFLPEGEMNESEYKNFWQSLAAGEYRQGNYRRKAKNGSIIWLQGAYSPYFDNRGRVIRVVKAVSDITAQMEAAEVSAEIGSTIASNFGEMSSAISDISSRVSLTADLANQAEFNATHARDLAVNLEQNSLCISKMLDLIESISQGTSLLALNATIESARAGEAGKGFAVVANEVKSLASQTGGATNDIRSSVEEIQSTVAEVVKSISAISEGIGSVHENASNVAASVEEQSVLMRELNGTASRLKDMTLV